ncbi:serine/threonine protein kinase [Paradesertivirga mongoliensis]|uniref:Serine/threonine protein kinase n=1 Tax=Paradesertivirga mongoliensis TaxID=2100740 RepID=A0ABW4ZJZ8_9SPHI|nr:serine/threonine-protein kinase [Pedobacter mongoliensis]
MGKVFTITEGLENMGALRTGGQGSVYKGRRIGEIISAVKLLPTPIHTENNDDKNFRDFQNEVEKLKKVNEEPNPNVVKILNSGITESGSFPFIEMEFIEGPDLEELLKPPHDPVFSIREVIKVADQLSNALAHCHKVSVKHGDIKSNNVKFNIRSGNYILLDFGLAIMSDEQRRSSLRHAGAIEFMAPEQNEGKMLFQTDVYSFGVILFELLAGVVPFPLLDNGETSRNTVMVSHMETPVPDVLELRRKHLPATWSADKKRTEMQVPEWLLAITSKCLEKKPENRFKDGVELHEAVISHSTSAVKNTPADAESVAVLQSEINRLNALVLQYQDAAASTPGLAAVQEERRDASMYDRDRRSAVSLSRPVFFTLLILLAGLGVFAAYSLLSKKGGPETDFAGATLDSIPQEDTAGLTEEQKDELEIDRRTRRAMARRDSVKYADSLRAIQSQQEELQNTPVPVEEPSEVGTDDEGLIDTSSERPSGSTSTEPPKVPDRKKYTLAVSKAHFHTAPDPSTRRSAHLVHWNNAELTALDDRNGFIYVVFFNTAGQITKGWLKKSDLRRIGQ